MDKYGIQINKTSRNTVLFMTNIGSTRSAVAYLIEVLVKIARDVDQRVADMSAIERRIHDKRVRSLTLEQPPLPRLLGLPLRVPRSAASRAARRRATATSAPRSSCPTTTTNCEYIGMAEAAKAIKAGRELVSALFVIPYPPGFPILVPGQVISAEILQFMAALDVREIHGFRPELGFRIFNDCRAGACRRGHRGARRAGRGRPRRIPGRAEFADRLGSRPTCRSKRQPHRHHQRGSNHEHQQSHQHLRPEADVPPQRAADLLHQRDQLQPAGDGPLDQPLPLHQLHRLLRRPPSERLRAAARRRTTSSRRSRTSTTTCCSTRTWST